MEKPKRFLIPKDVLLPLLVKMKVEKKSDPEGWLTYDYERLRSWCGPQYAACPLDDLKLYACNFRKAGVLPKSRNGRGIPKREQPPAKYLEYLKSEHWLEFKRTLAEFWDHRCALCNSDQKCDGHHRTYERLGKELLTDCVLLCRKCHQAADRARQRQKKSDQGELFQ